MNSEGNEATRVEKLKKHMECEGVPIPARILSEDEIKSRLTLPMVSTHMTKVEIALCLLYSMCYVIVAFLLFDPQVSGQINSHLRKHFESYKLPYSKVQTGNKFLEWFGEFLTHVHSTSYYPSRPYEHSGHATISGAHNLITLIRLTQRRMKVTNDIFGDFDNYAAQRWVNDGFNPNTLDLQDGEDTAPYGPNNTYRYLESKAMSGYATLFDALKTSANKSMSTLAHIKSTNYIDMQTRAVYVIYSLYSPQVEIYSLVFHTLVFSKTGATTCELSIYNFNERYYRGFGRDLFRAICEGIYVILLGLYALQHVHNVIRTFRLLQAEEEDERFAQEEWDKRHGKQVKQQGSIMLNICGIIKSKVMLVLKLLYVHLSNMWNLLDLANIILGLLIVIFWIRFVVAISLFPCCSYDIRALSV